MKILMLSPYDAASHRFWRIGLSAYLAERLPGLKLTQVTLPGRYFSWRFRGNSLSLSRNEALNDTYDLVIATSMTDLSALRGLNASLSDVPAIVYFHENQFAYPDSHREGQLERQLTSIYTGLSADWLFFNSAYNRSTFLQGADQLLRAMPDEVPGGIVDNLAARSEVLPVALETMAAKGSNTDPGVLKILWNHRWEADKGPALLLEIFNQLLTTNLQFRVSLLGQQFRQQPAELQACVSLLEREGRLNRAGFIEDRQAYLQSLGEHHVVLSTAQHEFQGLAVQEAMLRGCLPVVPDDLCYPEYVPPQYRYQSAEAAVQILMRIGEAINEGNEGNSEADSDQSAAEPAIDLSAYRWDVIGDRWLARISMLAIDPAISPLRQQQSVSPPSSRTCDLSNASVS